MRLPLSVIGHLKPVYEELSKPELLNMCLYGKTQNANESFNGTIWERIPKTTYVGLDKFEFGVYDAVANFNNGRIATIDIMRSLKMIPGRYTFEGCSFFNKRRLQQAAIKNSDSVKRRRKVIR